jgi:hypothetical protein
MSNDQSPMDNAETPESPGGEILLYQTADGRTRLECRFQDETIWLTQALMAELYQKDVRTINEHLKNIYDEGELEREATIRKYRIVRQEGSRQVTREIEHYSLDAILAVGYRVRSRRGTQFRRWAAERLREYLLKGFVMDDERLKNPPAPELGVHDYFDELLERIRDIRSSERRFYQKITDIYATAVDYDKDAPVTREFFATVQNKLHWAITGKTAGETIHVVPTPSCLTWASGFARLAGYAVTSPASPALGGLRRDKSGFVRLWRATP